MNYHINTIPVWDSFKAGGECPLCTLKEDVEKKLISQYLNEAVMEDSYRADVNKLGFCKQHFIKLYEGSNKLGVALQTHTRFKALLSGLKFTAKSGKDDVKFIRKQLSTCIVCDVTDFNMQRYYATIPKMYRHEDHFPELIKGGKGFCLGHFADLIEHANKAGKSATPFLEEINRVQEQNMRRLEQELNFFCDKFDYRNKDKPWGSSKDSLHRTINKIHGEIIEKP